MTVLNDFTLQLCGKSYRPLLIGGMGVDISTSHLALAAAERGAIGHISDAMAPFISDRDFGTKFQNAKAKFYKHFRDKLDNKNGLTWPLKEVYQSSLSHVKATMDAKKGDGGIFINVMEKLTMGNSKDTLKERLRGALDGGIDGITLSAGLHKSTLSLMADHPRFHDVALGIIVSSARALNIFIRSAKRLSRLPDYVIVEGPLAGGHLGFGLDWKKYKLEEIVAEVVAFLRSEKLDIKVIPAGGIFTGGDAVKFMQMGAHAVQVATRFTIAKECGLPTHVKQEYLRSSEADVEVNMTSPTGYPMRMLKSSPSLSSNIRPNCEALGYLLDNDGNCAYHQAYTSTPEDEKGVKLPVRDKMCICYHFMKFQCYTCGHNVFKLKDATHLLEDGTYFLPNARDIIDDYLHTEGAIIRLPQLPEGLKVMEVAEERAVA